MDDLEALALIDAHLDHEPLTPEQVAALTAWLQQHPGNADRAFHRIFLHTFLRQRIQGGMLAPTNPVDMTLPHEDAVLIVSTAASDNFKAAALPPPASRVPFKNVWWLTAALLVLLLMGFAASAWVISSRLAVISPIGNGATVYEGFRYPPTNPSPPLGDGNRWPTTGGLEGLHGGTGWASPWQEQGSKVSVLIADPVKNAWRNGDQRATGPLRYSDTHGNVLKTSGIQLRTPAGPLNTTYRKLDVEAFPVALPDTDGLGRDGGVLWISFLAQSFDGRGLTNYAYLQLGTDLAGVRLGKLAAVASGNWSACAVKDREEIAVQPGDLSSGDAVFFVMRIDFQPGDEVAHVWLNPPLDAEPALQSATFRLTLPDFRIEEVCIAGRYSTDFDEIRLGSSFADVAPRR